MVLQYLLSHLPLKGIIERIFQNGEVILSYQSEQVE